MHPSDLSNVYLLFVVVDNGGCKDMFFCHFCFGLIAFFSLSFQTLIQIDVDLKNLIR